MQEIARTRSRSMSRMALDIALLVAMTCGSAACEAADGATKSAGLQDVSREQFQADVVRLEQLAAACKTAAKACDSTTVGSNERVAAAGAQQGFVMSWDWLRTAIDTAGKAKADDRQHAMDEATGHLEELATASGASAGTDAGFAKARAEASQVLARAEFQTATGPSWMDRQKARFWAWVGSIFGGIGALGAAAPWLGTALEVLFYVAAAVGVLVFVLRAFARQRLAISLGAGTAKVGAWDKEAADWAALADSCAAQQEWREAVHCLYWAAIVRLEARRAWRHNPARTPREYVRLLKPGSPQQGSLRSLTQIFERVWYGLREASDEDYKRARSLFEGLSETQPSAATTESA